MDIKTYLEKEKLSQKDFGELLGVVQALVSRWANNPSSVTAEKAKQIEVKTKGAITRKELRPDLFG